MSVLEVTKCFHCGLPVPQHAESFPVQFDGETQQTCCAGCQAVAQTIVDQGMGAYYRQRKTEGHKIEALPQELLQQLALYDDPDIQSSFVRQVAAEQEATLLLEGITCAACIWLNEQTVRRLPGVTFISINYSNNRAIVRWDPSATKLSVILEAISHIGYTAHPFDAERQATHYANERKTALKRLFVSGFGMMQVMMYAWPAYFSDRIDLPLDQDFLLKWASLILTVPVILYSAWPFYIGSWRDLKQKRVGMDLPVTLGILGAFLPSVWATITQQGHVYFDSVAMFIFLLLTGRFLELTARRKASSSADGLSKLIPAFAHQLTHWPSSQAASEQAVARLKVGDIILVKPGEAIPVDGEIVQGESDVIEALLTGESRPIAKNPGMPVIGGSLNQSHPLIIKALNVGQNTRIASIVRLLDQALGEKPAVTELANRFASWFVFMILCVAAGTAIYWGQSTPERALWITVSVLVITCPCALSLAVPVALTAATGTLAKAGLLVTRGHSITTLAKIDHIVFDKTGTLTLGQLSVSNSYFFDDRAKIESLVRTMESHSEHPVAHALCRFTQGATLAACEQVFNHKGQGIEAVIDGCTYRLGKPSFISDFTAGPCPQVASAEVIWLASHDTYLAAFELADTLRSDAMETVQHFQSLGMTIHIASGDQPVAVESIARQLNIANWHANLTPEGKLALIETLQAQHHMVAMVGDGVNDAPVLAKAQLSIAMGAGADLARYSADIVLLGDLLKPCVQGWLLAQKTQKIIYQNLFWGLCYNFIAIPLAITGHVTPLIAGIGMASSSLIVVLNALRLTRITTK
ncbi:heavy metal translocating P-type ATPase [Leeia oryzae]|uniref:heavy metal translocating P-type ATPase n=1 Tax=Leeia oryzae TaxID=356662 RepID=UPI0003799778|nr:heavy metal translocating P-type ATPase [Leeia oryzae]